MFYRVLDYCNRSKPRLGDGLALGAGLLMPLAFAPFAIRLIPFVALPLFILLLHKLSPKHALLRGFLFGLGMFGLGVSWVFNSMYDFGSASIGVAALIAFSMVLINAVFFAGIAFTMQRYFYSASRLQRNIIVFPALWVIVEWLRSWLFTGFPWLFLGYSQVDTVLAAFTPVGGVFLTSFITVFLVGVMVLIVSTDKRYKLFVAGTIVGILLLAFGLRFVQWTKAYDEPLSVALVQGAVPQEIRMQPEQLPVSEQRYKELTFPYFDRDLIVWPETAIPTFAAWAEPYLLTIEEQLNGSSTDLLTGIFTRDSTYQRYYNSLLKLSAEKALSRPAYHKRRLVPFGEFMPFRSALEFMRGYIDIPMSDIAVGESTPMMILAGYPVALGVCYESAYPQIYREQLPEAAYMINVSNDAWFGDSFAPHQHLEIAQVRALEFGRYMLRATNTGISAVIDPRGRIIARSKQFMPEVLLARFRPYTGSTPYVLLGNWPVLILCFVLISAAVIPRQGLHMPLRK